MMGCSLKPLSQRLHLTNGLGGGLPIVIIPMTWIYTPTSTIILVFGGFYLDKMDTGVDVMFLRTDSFRAIAEM
jgi:hypothetical protein